MPDPRASDSVVLFLSVCWVADAVRNTFTLAPADCYADCNQTDSIPVEQREYESSTVFIAHNNWRHTQPIWVADTNKLTDSNRLANDHLQLEQQWPDEIAHSK